MGPHKVAHSVAILCWPYFRAQDFPKQRNSQGNLQPETEDAPN